MVTADIFWLKEWEYELLKDKDGWTLVFCGDHYNRRFWYEILTPDKQYLNFSTENIFEAIDYLNEAKYEYI